MHLVPALLFGPIASRWADSLEAGLPGADLRVAAEASEAEVHWPEIEVLFTWNRLFGPDQFRKAIHLRWVHSLSAGVDRLLFPELVSSGVVLTCTKGIHAPTMAQHAMALMLALARRLDFFVRAQAEARWVTNIERPPLHDLQGKTLAIVGLGAVGREIVRLALPFGMSAVAARRHREQDGSSNVDRVFGPDELSAMLSQADVVVVTCPLTPETAGLFGREAFAAMRPGAWLINLARGGVVQEEALVAALEEGRLGGAALDVFAREPLPSESPLWGMERVIITPHLSVASQETQKRAIALACENFRRFVGGQPLLSQVSKDLGY
jgi:D-2-hydroxyacid dehydrogenase (NADP+)